MMNRQRGLGLLRNIFVVFMLIAGVALAFKLVPPYTEYFMIKQIFKSLTVNPGLKELQADRSALYTELKRHTTVGNVTTIKIEDIDISATAISARYSVRLHLFGNISLLLEFYPSSAAN
jgi:hypothetical protein